MRINKYIADSGIASRRAADKLITEGRVKVNNKPVTELGFEINTDNDTVTVDGVKIAPKTRMIYIMFNKPKGCLCTVKDDRGRKTVMDYIKISEDKRVFPVGRLDYDTEGLLLLTNDGELAYRLTHPSYDVPKTYIAKVDGEVAESELAVLRKGVELDGIKTHAAKIKLLGKEDGISRFEVTIYEGRNRQIRRMFEQIGKNVIFLKRVAINNLRLGGLGRGMHRYLTAAELSKL